MKCSGFCIPFIIYIIFSKVLGLIGLIIRPLNVFEEKLHETKVTLVVGQLIYNVVIGGLIYWLCTKCYKTAAWIVLLFPIIFALIFMVVIIGEIGVISLHKKKNICIVNHK